MELIIARGTDDQVKDAMKYNKFLDDINGGLSQAEINQRLATEHFGERQEEVTSLVRQLNKTPGILKGMGREKKFADMMDGVADKLGMNYDDFHTKETLIDFFDSLVVPSWQNAINAGLDDFPVPIQSVGNWAKSHFPELSDISPHPIVNTRCFVPAGRISYFLLATPMTTSPNEKSS